MSIELPPLPDRMGLDAIRQAIEERDAMERQYHDLAEHMVYQGNSVSWWHSKAAAYRNAIDEVWDALMAAGVRADGTKTCADGVRELAAAVLAERERCAIVGGAAADAGEYGVGVAAAIRGTKGTP